ncbi:MULTISPECIES: TonB-dependent receptor [Sphingomonas]|jgi:TonB-dependent receptor|uniref:TonB-dependent receptor n=1 Tax=Sphingomonas TaxID=13687 RepID=UPI001AEAE7A2
MKSFGHASAYVWSASVVALAAGLALPQSAHAQSAPAPQDASKPADSTTGDDIVVTGVRASLERSIAIKRNSTGIVDAISAEDIGKFPDTNLAESLQRITGVSIDRVNGQGAQVTVRGFGPSFNLVTLNGRTLASSYVQTVGGDESADGTVGVTRSFDFSNLASEGVKTLEVYKTGRAAVPSGGIGATINVVTRRPLDSRQSGFNGTLGGKLNYDTSANDCVDCGSKVTPEITGLASWSNPDQTFGVSLFGSYQERHFSTVSATSNAWNIRTLADFLNPSNGFVNAATKINNAPTDPNQLVSVPNDSRYHFSDDKYQRLNGQAIVQFKPTDALTITADALFARTLQDEQRSDESNWFNRPFDVVTFDSNKAVATTTYLHETIAGVKDTGFEQQARAQKNQLEDYGLNAKWDIAHNFTLTIDGHYGKSSVLPNNSNGTSSTLVGLGANVITAHSVDYSGQIPVQDISISDASLAGGNHNGVLDVNDVGSSIGRTYTTSQRQKVKEIRADFGWDLGGGSRFDFGGLYRDTDTNQQLTSTQQTLGNWSVDFPGDVQKLAPGVLKDFCLLCKFNSYDPKGTGPNLVAFRGDALTLYNALSSAYAAKGNSVAITASQNNTVKETIYAGYGQVTWKGEIAGHNATLVAGARYEHTKDEAISLQAVPNQIAWVADNDFTISVGATPQTLRGYGSYDNILPSFDFQVELKRNLIGRFSASRTIARPNYDNLFASTSVFAPSRPTAIGGVATANTGNTNLAPLISDNFDLSFEYYFKPDSYVSAGFFDKRVHNFIGTGLSNGSLFGLRDPSSGTPGTLSGTAKAALSALGADISDVNLFTYSALLQRDGAAAAATQFNAHYSSVTKTVDQAFVNQILSAVDINGSSSDPLYNFTISRPINNKDAEIYGFEIAGQYFFGQTGIGVSGSFTYVKGDVGFNNGGDPNVDQFALTGLSNTANATLIYDKHGISARLSYNWRDKFLSQLNRDSYKNPVYTKAFGQLDMNISYDLNKKIALSIEGINLTNASLRTYGRSESNVWFAQELQRRFLFGARYRF